MNDIEILERLVNEAESSSDKGEFLSSRASEFWKIYNQVINEANSGRITKDSFSSSSWNSEELTGNSRINLTNKLGHLSERWSIMCINTLGSVPY